MTFLLVSGLKCFKVSENAYTKLSIGKKNCEAAPGLFPRSLEVLKTSTNSEVQPGQ
jgi:hypothetical protein